MLAGIQRAHVVVENRGGEFVVDPGPGVVGAFDKAGYQLRDLAARWPEPASAVEEAEPAGGFSGWFKRQLRRPRDS